MKLNLKKILVLFIILLFSLSLLQSKDIKITRDKTLVKNGAGNFYDTITVLKIGSVVQYIEPAKEDSGWLQISFNKKKGFISKMATEQLKNSSNKFDELDFSDIDKSKKNEIAPGSYTAAIKGFVLNYSKKKGINVENFDDLLSLTSFKAYDFFKVMNETKLSYFPKEGELIGIKDGFINQNMKAAGLSVSMNVLQTGVVMDIPMTKKLNIIANIINRQTWDYDVRYRVWIIKDDDPVAFSGPGGYIFVSSKLIEILTDNRELVAVIAHEVGHIALRHGIYDLSIEQARYSANEAMEELDKELDDETIKMSKELEEVVKEALDACKLVRDEKQEFEADEISLELLNRYKINKKYLLSALNKINLALTKKYPEYKTQMERRINNLSNK